MQRLKLTQIFPNNLVQTIWLVELNFAFNPYFFSISNILKVGLSVSQKNCVICSIDEKYFSYPLKSSFLSQDIKFLSWLIGHVEKKAWLERYG